MHGSIIIITAFFLVIVKPFLYDATESVSGYIDGTLIPRDGSASEDSVVGFTAVGETQPDSVDLPSTGTTVTDLQIDLISPDAQVEALRPCNPDDPDKVMRRYLGPCASWPSVVPEPEKLNPGDPHHMPDIPVPPAKDWPLIEPGPPDEFKPNPHKMPAVPDKPDPTYPLILLDDGDSKKCQDRKRTACCWGPANLPEVRNCVLCT